MVPLIFPSLNNRSRFRGVSSSSVRWSSHGGHVLDVELFVSNRRAFRFCLGEPREDGARKEKSETKLSRENSRKRRIVVSSSKETSKKDLSFSRGEKREFLRHFFPQRRERFSTFFSSESVNKREGRKGKKK